MRRVPGVLRGKHLPAAALLADVRERVPTARPAPTWRADVDRALALDRFGFAIQVRREDGL